VVDEYARSAFRAVLRLRRLRSESLFKAGQSRCINLSSSPFPIVPHFPTTMLVLTTSSAIVAVVAQYVTTVKVIHDVLQEYKNVPQVLKGIREETAAIGGFLNAIVLSLERNPEVLQAAGLTSEFDVALESCRGAIVRVATYLTSLKDVNWKRRLNVVWNEKELGMLRDDLRSKQISLAMLVQALNM